MPLSASDMVTRKSAVMCWPNFSHSICCEPPTDLPGGLSIFALLHTSQYGFFGTWFIWCAIDLASAFKADMPLSRFLMNSGPNGPSTTAGGSTFRLKIQLRLFRLHASPLVPQKGHQWFRALRLLVYRCWHQKGHCQDRRTNGPFVLT